MNLAGQLKVNPISQKLNINDIANKNMKLQWWSIASRSCHHLIFVTYWYSWSKPDRRIKNFVIFLVYKILECYTKIQNNIRAPTDIFFHDSIWIHAIIDTLQCDSISKIIPSHKHLQFPCGRGKTLWRDANQCCEEMQLQDVRLVLSFQMCNWQMITTGRQFKCTGRGSQTILIL